MGGGECLFGEPVPVRRIEKDQRERLERMGGAELGGVTAKYAEGGSLGYGDSAIYFWVNEAEAPVAADPKSGLHFCFAAPTRKSVDAFHAAALRAGGRDNGAPGPRADYGPNYYAAFVIDPDGYRIEAYCGREE